MLTRAPAIYLDNNATTPLDPRVIAEMIPTLDTHFGNPASGTHPYGWYAEELVTIARERVSVLLGSKPGEIVFTSGGTEANNLAIFGVIRAFKARNPLSRSHLITAATEHKSVLDTVRAAEAEGVDITVLPVGPEGSVTPEAVIGALKPETILVSLMLANNEMGALHPIAELGKQLRARKILFHSDAVQAAGKLQLDVHELGVDFLSLTAHKIYGPKGVGALYVSEEVGSRIAPLLFGGGHEHGLRSGTLNVCGIVGFGKAAELARTEMANDVAQLLKLGEFLLALLRKGIPGLQLNGPKINRLPGNFNLYFPGIDNIRLLGKIQTKVALSLGSACQSASNIPSFVLQALGYDRARQTASVRLGIGRFTTAAEIQTAADIILKALGSL